MGRGAPERLTMTDWVRKTWGEPDSAKHLPVKQVCRMGTLFKRGLGPQCHTDTMNKGPYFHLHPGCCRHLFMPAVTIPQFSRTED